MKNVNLSEYRAFVRANCKPENDKPVLGETIAAMQHFDNDGSLIAQAVYYRGYSPLYSVRLRK